MIVFTKSTIKKNKAVIYVVMMMKIAPPTMCKIKILKLSPCFEINLSQIRVPDCLKMQISIVEFVKIKILSTEVFLFRRPFKIARRK